jgi:hypothetical protein
MQKRQTILLGILGVLVVVFLLWTFVFKSGDTGSGTTEQPTVTSVVTETGVVDPAAPAVPSEPGVTDPAAPAAPVAEVPFNPNAYRNPFERAG